MELSIIWRHLIHFGPRHSIAQYSTAYMPCRVVPQPQRRSSLLGGLGLFFLGIYAYFYTWPSRLTRLQTSIEVDQIIYSRLGFGVCLEESNKERRGIGRRCPVLMV